MRLTVCTPRINFQSELISNYSFDVILNDRRDLAEILESIVTPAASRRRLGIEESLH